MKKTAVGVVAFLSLAATVFAVNPQMPVIPSTVFNVTDYGAVGDGVKDNTTNIQNTINAANAAGGGIVEIPAGTFLSGPITLLSEINLRLDSGAKLQALPLYAYPGGVTNAQTFIGCNGVHDLEISGTGTIDGQGGAWWTYFRTNNSIVRPMMLNLYNCNRLFIHDVRYQNPPNHHCGLRGNGGNITISNLTVFTTNNSPNTDGLNFVATNSIIENCFISDGDDNIAMGSTGPLMDLLITNCNFGYGHGVSLGSGISGVTNLTVINCTFTNTGNGIRIKCARDNSLPVKNLNYLNLTMMNVNLPIVIYSYYDELGTPDHVPFSQVLAASNSLPVNSTTPLWRDLTFSNLNIVSHDIAGVIWGPTEQPVTNVTFIHVTNTAPKTFFFYNVHGIKVFDSKFSVSSMATFTLCNADVTVSNSLRGAPAISFNGASAGTNSFALYNADASLTNNDAFAATPITISGSTLTVSNNFFPASNTVVNYVLGTNAATIAVKGNLVLHGTNNIIAGAGFTNGTYLLMTYTGTLSGTLPTLASVPFGYNCAFDTSTAKQVKLVVMPAGPQPPPAPLNLAATPSNALVALTWSPSATATNYNIKRSTVSGSHTFIASTTATNYFDTQVTNGVTYYYVVSAVNTNGEGLDSAEVFATPQPQVVFTNSGLFDDLFFASTVNSASPAAPTSLSTSYEILSSKSWNPPPTINTNHLIFGIAATSSGCIEMQALFTNAPLALANIGDTISLTVTFTNTAGLLTGSGMLGFGLYNSGQNYPVPGGLNGNLAITNGFTLGNAQTWQGYWGQLSYTGINSQILTRPAQNGGGNNNQDCVTTGSGASYSNPAGSTVGAASTAPSLALVAGNPYTEVFAITLADTNTLAITNSFYSGTDTRGTLLAQFGGVASGSMFLTNSFDAFAVGWRETGSQATTMDINNISINASMAAAGTIPSTTPTNIVMQVIGNQLQLSWPQDHLGWRLEIQTNDLATGLSTNWTTVPNSMNVISTNILMNSTNRSVFLRLVYP
ncbi:MAG TPA: glycosyl hydrolase family 28 protein [Verrucomicrobiae bacterium]|nr:glycosyl hydrolase family 28 protein [Verrucomicrobiae bacterium]